MRGRWRVAVRSIAVMACSPDLSHLTRQDSLHQRILAAGAAVSEFPPGFFEPQRWSFIASRRIVPALADVVVIVEAGGFTHSALSTKIATELGRDIAVVPGRFTDPSGERILRLLQDGAHPVATAEARARSASTAPGCAAPHSTTRRRTSWLTTPQ